MYRAQPWSSTSGEGSTSEDMSGSHSEDYSSDDDEGGPSSLEYSDNASLKGMPYLAQKTPRQRGKGGELVENTPMTADMSSESTSGSEDDGAVTPKVNLTSSRMQAITQGSNGRQSQQYSYEMAKNYAATRYAPASSKSGRSSSKNEAPRQQSSSAKKSKKTPSERKRGIGRSKSADTGSLLSSYSYEEQNEDNEILSQALGMKPAFVAPSGMQEKFQRRASLSAVEPLGRAKRRSSLVSTYLAPAMEAAAPVAAPVDEERAAKMAEKEKVMERLERIKAKAIKSANKELGVEQGKLAAVMGMGSNAPTMLATKSQGRQQSMEQRRVSAASSGSSGSKGLFQEAIKNIRVEDTETESEDDDSAQEDQDTPSFAAQPNSLAAALGMSIDPSSSAPPVRERGVKLRPIAAKGAQTVSVQPNSLAAALGMSVDLSSSGPSIGQSSIQASRSIPPQSNSLFAALGIATDPMPSVHVRNEVKTLSDSESDYSSDDEKRMTGFQPQVGSLAEALGMVVDPSSRAAPVRQIGDRFSAEREFARPTTAKPAEQSSTSHGGPRFLPQAGSLAEALGISVDPSSRAPVIRYNDKAHVSVASTQDITPDTSDSSFPVNTTGIFLRQAGTLEDAIGMSDSSSQASEVSDESADGDMVRFAPQPGSLAEALGMGIDPSSRAPPVRPIKEKVVMSEPPKIKTYDSQSETSCSGSSDDESEEDEMVRFAPQAGSLAEALGMGIDPSSRAPPVRPIKEKLSTSSLPVPSATKSVDSRSEASYSGSSEYDSEQDEMVRFAPQAGSLAEALGMGIDPSSRAPPVRPINAKSSTNNLPVPSATKSVDSRSEASYSGSSDDESEEDEMVRFAPQAGSLAEALGMGIDPSSRAPPVRPIKEKLSTSSLPVPSATKSVDSRSEASYSGSSEYDSEQDEMVRFAPQAGSLAEALGMGVDPSSRAPPVRPINAKSSTNNLPVPSATKSVDSRSEASYSGSSDDESEEDEMVRFAPQAGSLAEALGMGIDPSSRAPPVRPIAPPKTKTYDSRNQASYSDSSHYESEQEEKHRIAPQAGSLAEALGMGVDPSSRAPPVRPAKPTQSLFDTVVKRAVDMQGGKISVSQLEKPQSGSLAAALGMDIDPSSGSAPIRNSTPMPMPSVPKKNLFDVVSTEAPESSRPFKSAQAGSLAAALGMTVDSSMDAPQVRHIAQPSVASSRPKKNLFESVMSNAVANFNPARSVEAKSKAQAGSLAAALGMGVDFAQDAPPVRSAASTGVPKKNLFDIVSPEAPESSKSVGSAKPGSLAAALGMTVDSSMSAPQVRQVEPTDAPPSGSKKSLFGAVMTNAVAASKPTRSNEAKAQAQAGSLAAALGMRVETSPEPPAPSPMASQAHAGSLAAALGVPVSTSSMPPARPSMASQAQAGSLAAALGMTVDSSMSAPQVREVEPTNAPPSGSKKSLFGAVMTNAVAASKPTRSNEAKAQAQAGSLAAALGMRVETSPEPPAPSPMASQAHAGSLAAALGVPVSTSSMPPARPSMASQAQAGSLAAALGMTVDSSMSAPQVREVEPTNAPPSGSKKSLFGAVMTNAVAASKPTRSNEAKVHAQAGSLAAALGVPVSTSSMPPARPSMASQAQAGSLAAALGMTVESTSNAAQVGQVEPSNRLSSEPKKSLFDTVISKAANATSKSSAESSMAMPPQAGSLAAALGVSIAFATPVPRPNQTPTTRGVSSQPQSGSLAAALGMVVKTSPPGSPPVVSPLPSMTPNVEPRAQAGSLAAALGMPVDTNTPTAVRPGNGVATKQQPSQPIMNGSLAAALGISASAESNGMAQEDSQIWAGSLAAALTGMNADSSAKALPGRQSKTPTGKKSSLFDTVIQSAAGATKQGKSLKKKQQQQPQTGSLVAALGVSVKSTSSNSPTTSNKTDMPSVDTIPKQRKPLKKKKQRREEPTKTAPLITSPKPIPNPQPMSAVEARGTGVAADDRIPKKSTKKPKKQTQADIAAAQTMSAVQARAGSIAAALGLPMASAEAPPKKDVEKLQQQAKTQADFAAAQTMSAVQARAGSIAAALGLPMASAEAPPKKDVEKLQQQAKTQADVAAAQTMSAVQARAGSIAAALGLPMASAEAPPKKDVEKLQQQAKTQADVAAAQTMSAVQARAGSIAAALGLPMASAEAPPKKDIEKPQQQTQTATQTMSDVQARANSITAALGLPDQSGGSIESSSTSRKAGQRKKNLFAALAEESSDSAMQSSGLSQDSSASTARKPKSSHRKSLFEPVDPEPSTLSEKESARESSGAATQQTSTTSGSDPDREAKSRPASKKGNIFDATSSDPDREAKSRTTQQRSSTSKKGNIFDAALGKTKTQSPQMPAETPIQARTFMPQPVTTEEKRAHKEKAMSRLDRIKAKAIKSANKELGVDEMALASAMGMKSAQPSGNATTTRGESAQGSDPSEAEQMKNLAASLGLPASFFGAPTSPTSPTRKKKSLLESAVRDVSVGKKATPKMARLTEGDEEDGASTDAPSADFPIDHEPSSAVSVQDTAADLPSRVLPNKERTFKPQPITAEEKRADKEQAMSRLERIKAKALKSAQRELGVDVDGLASVMGMNPMKTESAKNKAKPVPTTQAAEEEAEQMELLAESLGLPPSFFGIVHQNQAKKNATPSKPDRQQDATPATPVAAPVAPETALVTPGSLAYSEKNEQAETSMTSQSLSGEIEDGVELDKEMAKDMIAEDTSKAFLEATKKLSMGISEVQVGVNEVMKELCMTRGEIGQNSGITEVQSGLKQLTDEIANARGEISGVKLALASMEGKLDALTPIVVSKVEPTLDVAETEKSMKAALAEFEAKAEGATAYSKSLEEQLMKKTNSYSEKLSQLHEQLVTHEREVSEKAETIKRLEASAGGEAQAQEFVANRWSETENRLLQACNEIQAFRSLLAQEYEEIKLLKSSLDEERLALISSRLEVFDADSLSTVSASKDDLNDEDNLATLTSAAILNIQRKLQLEGQRRKTLTARLKAKRKNQRKAIIDSSKLQDKLVVKLDEKAAERASPNEKFTFEAKYAEDKIDQKAGKIEEAVSEGINTVHGDEPNADNTGEAPAAMHEDADIETEDALGFVNTTRGEELAIYPGAEATDADPATEASDSGSLAVTTAASQVPVDSLTDIAQPADASELEQELPKAASEHASSSETDGDIMPVQAAQRDGEVTEGIIPREIGSTDECLGEKSIVKTTESDSEAEKLMIAVLEENTHPAATQAEESEPHAASDKTEDAVAENPIEVQRAEETPESKEELEVLATKPETSTEAQEAEPRDIAETKAEIPDVGDKLQTPEDAQALVGETMVEVAAAEDDDVAVDDSIVAESQEDSSTKEAVAVEEGKSVIVLVEADKPAPPEEPNPSSQNEKSPAASEELKESDDHPIPVQDEFVLLAAEAPELVEEPAAVANQVVEVESSVLDETIGATEPVLLTAEAPEAPDVAAKPAVLNKHVAEAESPVVDETIGATEDVQVKDEPVLLPEPVEGQVTEAQSSVLDEPIVATEESEEESGVKTDDIDASPTAVEIDIEEMIVPPEQFESVAVEADITAPEQSESAEGLATEAKEIEDAVLPRSTTEESVPAEPPVVTEEPVSVAEPEVMLDQPDDVASSPEAPGAIAAKESETLVQEDVQEVSAVLETEKTQEGAEDSPKEEEDTLLVEVSHIPESVRAAPALIDDDASTDTPLTSNKEKTEGSPLTGAAKQENETLQATKRSVAPPPPDYPPEDKEDDTSASMLAAFGFILLCSFASYVTYVGSGSPVNSTPFVTTGEPKEAPVVAPTNEGRNVVPVDDAAAPASSPEGEKRLRSAQKRSAALKKKLTINQEINTSGSEYKNYEVPLMAMSFVNIRDDQRVDILDGDDDSRSSDGSTGSGTSSRASDSSESSMEDFNPLPAPHADLFAPSLTVYHLSQQPSQSREARKAARRRYRKKFIEGLNSILKKELEDDYWM